MLALLAISLIVNLKSFQLVSLASKSTTQMLYMSINSRQTCVILIIVTRLTNRILEEHKKKFFKRFCLE